MNEQVKKIAALLLVVFFCNGLFAQTGKHKPQ